MTANQNSLLQNPDFKKLEHLKQPMTTAFKSALNKIKGIKMAKKTCTPIKTHKIIVIKSVVKHVPYVRQCHKITKEEISYN